MSILYQTVDLMRYRTARRARESKNRTGNPTWVHVCMYGIWNLSHESRHVAQQAMVPKCRSPERALLRHHIIGVATSNQRAARETAKLSQSQESKPRMHDDHSWQQPMSLDSEDGSMEQKRQTASGSPIRSNH